MEQQVEGQGIQVIDDALRDGTMARVNLTYGGQNGDLVDPVSFDASDTNVRTWLTEALRSGSIPGIPAATNADLSDFVVDRFSPTEARPYALLSVRPKVPFGVS